MRDQGSDTGCRCGAAADRLEHNPSRLSNLTQLINDKETVLTITEDRWLAESIAPKTLAGLLKQRMRPGQAMELLRKRLARKWPKPGACSPTQNEWPNLAHDLRHN